MARSFGLEALLAELERLEPHKEKLAICHSLLEREIGLHLQEPGETDAVRPFAPKVSLGGRGLAGAAAFGLLTCAQPVIALCCRPKALAWTLCGGCGRRRARKACCTTR